MKLNTAQVEKTLSQFTAEVLPDAHPARAQLNELFGDHTFFLNNSGLNIVEPVEDPETEDEAGEVVNLAHWSDATFARLKIHDPEHTGVIVSLEEAKH
jgi:hypothetical protein